MQILAQHNFGTIQLSDVDRDTSHWIKVEFNQNEKWDHCHFRGFITVKEARMLRLKGYQPCFVKASGWRAVPQQNWHGLAQGEYIAAMYSRWMKPGDRDVYAIVEDGEPHICMRA